MVRTADETGIQLREDLRYQVAHFPFHDEPEDRCDAGETLIS